MEHPLFIKEDIKLVCPECSQVATDNYYVINHRRIHDKCYHYRWQKIRKETDYKKERVGVC